MSSQIPPGADLTKLPAGVPPPGVIPNLVDPHDHGPIFLILGPILMFFMICFLSVRVYAKAFIIRAFTSDDLTCAVAALGTICYFIIICFALTNKTFGRHIWDVSVASLATKNFAITSYLTNWFPNPIWLCAKLTFLLLFLQIFRPNRQLRYFIWGGIVICSLFYISITIPQIYWATPQPGQTWLENLQHGRTAKTQAVSLPLAGFNLATDVYIFVIPMWGVMGIQLSRRRKIGVCLIFATGFSAVVTSLVALIYKVRLSRDPVDFTWLTFPAMITNYVEMVVGISAACMPACSTTLRHHAVWFEQVGSRISNLATRRSSSRKSQSSGNHSNGSANRPYINIDYTKPKPKASNGSTKSDIELRNINTKAFVDRGRPSESLGDGIHLTHEVEQNWERT